MVNDKFNGGYKEDYKMLNVENLFNVCVTRRFQWYVWWWWYFIDKLTNDDVRSIVHDNRW